MRKTIRLRTILSLAIFFVLIGNTIKKAPGQELNCPSLELIKSLSEPSKNDDAIRTLQREKLEAIFKYFEAVDRKKDLAAFGRQPQFVASPLETVAIAGQEVFHSALELSDTIEQSQVLHEGAVHFMKSVESRAIELANAGARGGETEIVAKARFLRLEAEIAVLKFKNNVKSEPKTEPASHSKLSTGQESNDSLEALTKTLCELNTHDDDLRKLQKEKLAVELERCGAFKAKCDAGLVGRDYVELYMLATKDLYRTGLEVAENREQKIRLLEGIVQIMEKMEQRVLGFAAAASAGAAEDRVALARINKLAAQIDLLKFKMTK